MIVLLAHDLLADGFDTPEGAAPRGHRMPQWAWEGIRLSRMFRGRRAVAGAENSLSRGKPKALACAATNV